MNISSSATCLLLITTVMMWSTCSSKSSLSIWIDSGQVQVISGYKGWYADLYLIQQGEVNKYLDTPDFEDTLPSIPAEIDTVNLTWEAGDELYTYWFDNLKSKNKSILYNPLLSIPSSGIVPKGPKMYDARLGKNVATRKQIPVKPAFGITIHKAQGMTLERNCLGAITSEFLGLDCKRLTAFPLVSAVEGDAMVDCSEIFQPGQLTVALSRVKSGEGLFIRNFHPKYCIASPTIVQEFLQRPSTDLIEDTSCCRNNKRHDSPLTTSALPEPPSCDEQINETGEDEFDEEFDNFIRAIDTEEENILRFNLPEDFSTDSVLEELKVSDPVTPSQQQVNIILMDINTVKVELFCKKEFLAVSNLLSDLNITEPVAIPAKQLGKFYSNIHSHLSSIEYRLNCFSLFDGQAESVTDDHFHICFNLHLAVRKYLLQQKVNLYTFENKSLKKRFLTSASRAKLRYVAGYCVAKLSHKYSKQKNANRFSTSSEGQLIYEECNNMLCLLKLLKEEENWLKGSTCDKSSLSEIIQKQNITSGLTHIADDVFSWFVSVCEMCLNLLVGENLQKYGSDLYSFCYAKLIENEKLSSDFNSMINKKLEDDDSPPAMKLKYNQQVLHKSSENIFGFILNKFLMVMFSQFRKDLKSIYHLEKTMAHRKQIQVTKQKKDTKLLNVDPSEPSTSTGRTTAPSSKKTARSKKKSLDQPSTSTMADPNPGTSKRSTTGSTSQRKRKRKSKQTTKKVTTPSEDTAEVYICPACQEVDQGFLPMIGCDKCFQWFHWHCVGIAEEPEEELWLCNHCKDNTTD